MVRSRAITDPRSFVNYRTRRLEPWGRPVLRDARHAMAEFWAGFVPARPQDEAERWPAPVSRFISNDTCCSVRQPRLRTSGSGHLLISAKSLCFAPDIPIRSSSGEQQLAREAAQKRRRTEFCASIQWQPWCRRQAQNNAPNRATFECRCRKHQVGARSRSIGGA
jgi:hypothetical protein